MPAFELSVTTTNQSKIKQGVRYETPFSANIPEYRPANFTSQTNGGAGRYILGRRC